MMRNSMFAVAAFAALGWWSLPATAASPNLTGFVDLLFDRPVPDSYIWVYEGYVVSINLTVPNLNISIDPSVIGPGTLNWSNPSIWNPITLNSFGLLITAEGNGSYVTHVNNDAQYFDVLYGHGPTQTTARTNVTFGFFGTTQ